MAMPWPRYYDFVSLTQGQYDSNKITIIYISNNNHKFSHNHRIKKYHVTQKNKNKLKASANTYTKKPTFPVHLITSHN